MSRLRELKQTLGPEARERMKAEIESQEQYRQGLEHPDENAVAQIVPMAGKPVDLDRLDRQIAAQKRVLEASTPQRFTGKERELAEKRYRLLQKELPERLLTHRENELLPKDGREFRLAKQKAQRMETGNPQTQALIHEYRELGRGLDPDNPDASSIDALRKDH